MIFTEHRTAEIRSFDEECHVICSGASLHVILTSVAFEFENRTFVFVSSSEGSSITTENLLLCGEVLSYECF